MSARTVKMHYARFTEDRKTQCGLRCDDGRIKMTIMRAHVTCIRCLKASRIIPR